MIIDFDFSVNSNFRFEVVEPENQFPGVVVNITQKTEAQISYFESMMTYVPVKKKKKIKRGQQNAKRSVTWLNRCTGLWGMAVKFYFKHRAAYCSHVELQLFLKLSSEGVSFPKVSLEYNLIAQSPHVVVSVYFYLFIYIFL